MRVAAILPYNILTAGNGCGAWLAAESRRRPRALAAGHREDIAIFSGLVEEVGKIVAVTDTADGRRLKVGAKAVTEGVKLGDSIAVNGTCLTVVDCSCDWFAVEAVLQTLRVTGLAGLKAGSPVNLERALLVSDRLGGHLVSGHVDARGRVSAIEKDGFSRLMTFAVPGDLRNYFVEKGSVAVDGVSLTVAAVCHRPASGASAGDFEFKVALIPHTMDATTLGALKVGDTVNIEADLIAKYVARWVAPMVPENLNKAGLSLGFLAEHGYTLRGDK